MEERRTQLKTIEEIKKENQLRYLILRTIPEVGDYCIGEEIDKNGVSKKTRTDMVRKVKEILTGKYMIYTVSAIYMANII
jgi:hypothetical protein